jgi:hypothetical protein
MLRLTGVGPRTAGELWRTLGIASLDDLIGYLATDRAMAPHLEAVRSYRERYGVKVDA